MANGSLASHQWSITGISINDHPRVQKPVRRKAYVSRRVFKMRTITDCFRTLVNVWSNCSRKTPSRRMLPCIPSVPVACSKSVRWDRRQKFRQIDPETISLFHCQQTYSIVQNAVYFETTTYSSKFILTTTSAPAGRRLNEVLGSCRNFQGYRRFQIFSHLLIPIISIWVRVLGYIELSELKLCSDCKWRLPRHWYALAVDSSWGHDQWIDSIRIVYCAISSNGSRQGW